LALLPLWGKADDLVLAYITLARIHLAQANRKDARDAIEKAIHVVQASGVFPEAPHILELAQVKVWLAEGNLQAAAYWADSLEQRFDSDRAFKFENEVTHIARARVWIAQNKIDKAIDLLSRVEKIARSAARMGRVIEILLLEALALQKAGDEERAMLALRECLTLAEPESYVRVFLDEGQPMQRLLAQWLANSRAGSLQDYAMRLLSAFDAKPLPRISHEKASPAGGLVEPLSQRELEVLQLMALGRTNQEIAQQLIVSRGTVKAHTASIYRKLDVANRTEAAARAKQLGILL
jgi:LuxR family maltose regulon positive regulatory protein